VGFAERSFLDFCSLKNTWADPKCGLHLTSLNSFLTDFEFLKNKRKMSNTKKSSFEEYTALKGFLKDIKN